MQLRDNGLKFSPITIVMHWTVVILLLSIIGLSVALSQSGDDAQKQAYLHLQNLLGAMLFLISVYRFWARVTSYHPLPLGTPNPVEVIASRSVAAALALAMVLLPLAAWLTKCAAGETIGLPGGWAIPAPFGPNAEAHHVLGVLFNTGATAFLAGLALHIFGALKNHLILKNDALKRMLGKQVEL